MSNNELNTKIHNCNMLIQAGISSLDSLLKLKGEDLEMIHEIGIRLKSDIAFRTLTGEIHE